LCGALDDADYTIAILREDAGRGGSTFLHANATVGTTLRVRGPRNHFPLVPDADSYVLIAGGIGITPIKAMAQALQASGRPWRLFYGGRTSTSMAYASELAALAPELVSIQPEDQAGLLDLRSILADVSGDTVVYCCGPTGLLEAAAQAIVDCPAHELHVERFTSTPKDPAAEVDVSGDDFIVELAASGLEVTVSPGQTILSAVLDVLPDTPWSCEDGFCGSCETTVLGGIPEHHDTVLTEAQQEKNDCMMICVGRSATPRLVLDL
jgi:ferredoxin-NADP reductase